MSAKTAKSSARSDNSPGVSKDVASLQVSLPEMLDLALGTPEVGAVNLNILHNFLHILLHQINLRSTKVEYRGDDANRIKTMVTSLKGGPSLYLHEYSITDGSNAKQRVRPGDTSNVKVNVVTDESQTKSSDEKPGKQAKPGSAPVTEREKSEKQKETAQGDTATMKTKGVRQQVGPGTEGESETVIFVEPIVDGAAPTALGFKRLEQTVNELRQRFQALEELPTNPELIERLKGKITDPLTDVWQIISITKRLDASEQGIDKLTTMVQDVLKGDTSAMATEDTGHFEERLMNLENALNNLDQTVKNLQILSNMMEDEGEEGEMVLGETSAVKDDVQQPAQRISLSQLLGGVDITEMHQDVAALKKQLGQMQKDFNGLSDKVAKTATVQNTETPAAQPTTPKQEAAQKEQRKQESSEAQKEAAEPSQPEKNVGQTSEKAKEETPAKRKEPSKAKEPKRAESPKEKQPEVATDETLDSDTAKTIHERIAKLENDVTCLFEKVDSAPMAGVSGSAELDQLVSKIHGIQSDMEKLNETADRLIDDRENREVHLNALLEQVELLKTIKADREDLEDALAGKADAQAINRKVSYDQFDATCDDLAQGLEDAIGKLGKQESIWQQALDEVQKEIEGKVDKIEISPLKDFVTNRLKTLQEKLKSVAQMRQESEAAGSKKLLRDVQCISCDKNVVMKMEDTQKFRVEPLPCNVSMKPYLTYKLDQVRKQHRRLPHSRNMIQFEAAMQEEARNQKSARADTLVKTPRDHLCNRYCGGSHTVTTPQQRVMRMGHFLSQWGPEVVQLTEGVVQGTDGKMYKSRLLPGKFDVCGPAYCEDRGDEVRTPERQPSVTAPPRKTSERQGSIVSRRRSSRKQSKEQPKEVIEEVIEATIEIEDQESDDLPFDPSSHTDRVVRYDEEEMEDNA